MVKIAVNLSPGPMTQNRVMFLNKNIYVHVLLFAFESPIAAARSQILIMETVSQTLLVINCCNMCVPL